MISLDTTEVVVRVNGGYELYLSQISGTTYDYGYGQRSDGSGTCELTQKGSGPVAPSPSPSPAPTPTLPSTGMPLFVCPWGEVVFYSPNHGALENWGGAGYKRGFTTVSMTANEVEIELSDGSTVYLVHSSGSSYAYSYLTRDPYSGRYCDLK